MNQIGHIGVMRWFPSGERWSGEGLVKKDVSNFVSNADSVVKATMEEAAGKLHHIISPKGDYHYYAVRYADPQCGDPQAVNRGPSNTVCVRFKERINDPKMLADLEKTLRELPVPSEHTTLGAYQVVIKDGRVLSHVEAPAGLKMLQYVKPTVQTAAPHVPPVAESVTHAPARPQSAMSPPKLDASERDIAKAAEQGGHSKLIIGLLLAGAAAGGLWLLLKQKAKPKEESADKEKLGFAANPSVAMVGLGMPTGRAQPWAPELGEREYSR